ncbi:MAG: hypothetical protein SOR77_08640 [Peptoniphilus sp.]|uniref:phage tail terminator family protein n=1 Tax=Peptoniphilus sp. TaxID=1971214 RepID=UPI002A74B1F3|nr:hypothetical protein [Peptoniphilus sp.]MDY2987684.1 hypothetical protein [Peptoniphilus sp.]
MIKLLQAVVNRLDELFPETNIYIKDTEQGLIEPCFFVQIVNTDISLEFQRRYRVDSLINIVYLNQNATAYIKEEVGQRLIYGMRNIRLETGGVYGFDASVKNTDFEVNFTINYRYNTKEFVEKDPYMMRIENIIHYEDEKPYKEATQKDNPGMWESDLPKESRGVIPEKNIRNNGKLDEEDLMFKKEINLYVKD